MYAFELCRALAYVPCSVLAIPASILTVILFSNLDKYALSFANHLDQGQHVVLLLDFLMQKVDEASLISRGFWKVLVMQ